MPQGLQSPLRCGGAEGDWQQRQSPALPEARVPKTRGGSQGDGDGSQPGQAVVSCRLRGDSEGYRTAYPSESQEMARPPTRANTAPEPSLEHDTEALERPARARTAPVARHTEPCKCNLVSARSIVGVLFSGLLSCLDWQSLLLVCLLVSPGACWFYRKSNHSSKQYMQDTHIPQQ